MQIPRAAVKLHHGSVRPVFRSARCAGSSECFSGLGRRGGEVVGAQMCRCEGSGLSRARADGPGATTNKANLDVNKLLNWICNRRLCRYLCLILERTLQLEPPAGGGLRTRSTKKSPSPWKQWVNYLPHNTRHRHFDCGQNKCQKTMRLRLRVPIPLPCPNGGGAVSTLHSENLIRWFWNRPCCNLARTGVEKAR